MGSAAAGLDRAREIEVRSFEDGAPNSTRLGTCFVPRSCQKSRSLSVRFSPGGVPGLALPGNDNSAVGLARFQALIDLDPGTCGIGDHIGRVELGFSNEELASALGKPTSEAVRKAAQRALLRLAQEMSPES